MTPERNYANVYPSRATGNKGEAAAIRRSYPEVKAISEALHREPSLYDRDLGDYVIFAHRPFQSCR